MAFSDPQVVTINTVDKTLNRIKSDGLQSVYVKADESVKLTISHQEAKGRTRHMARLDNRVVATDPLSSVQEYKNLGVYVVIDEPEYGFDDDGVNKVVQALTAWLSEANVLKILSSQH